MGRGYLLSARLRWAMVDILVRMTPLPVPRPSGLDYEYQPSIQNEWGLEASEKAVDAFSGVGSYHPSSQEVNRISEAVIGFKRLLANIGEFMNFSSHAPYVNQTFESIGGMSTVLGVVGIGVAATMAFFGMKAIWKYMGWDW